MVLFLSLSKSALWEQTDQESGEEAVELTVEREAAGGGEMPSTEALSGPQRARLQTGYFNIKAKAKP